MGSFWLHKAVAPLQAALGPKFKLYSNYASRCRSSGGFNDIRGIVMHHDADNTSGDDDWVVRYEYETAQDRPIGNFHVQRDGDVWFGAAGASNHAGKGGPVSTKRGTVPLNQGNLYLIGIEASNNGVGEVWPKALMESYLILVTVLCKTFTLDPFTDIYGHWTWCEPSCPGRKIDPRGPTPSYPKIGGSSGLNKWNMQEVRKEVNARIATSTPVPPKPTPVPPPTPVTGKYFEGGDCMIIVSKETNSTTIWYSINGGYSRLGLRNTEQARNLGSELIDAKTGNKLTSYTQAGTLNASDLDRVMGPKVA